MKELNSKEGLYELWGTQNPITLNIFGGEGKIAHCSLVQSLFYFILKSLFLQFHDLFFQVFSKFQL